MRLLLISALAITLVACGGGAPSQPTSRPVPVAGTLLSSECQQYTLVEKFADGQGGSTEEVTSRSPDCGWNPPPDGELSDAFCEEPYTLVSVYPDGEYGFYEGREEDVEECGYIPTSLDVVIDNTYGDRFRPVIVTVEYIVQGEEAEWTYEVEMGRAVKVDDNTLHIYGDGSGDSVDFNLQINEESYLYQLRREPRCASEPFDSGMRQDCLGYQYRGRNDGMIYYGEDDTQVVEWDIAFHITDRRAEEFLVVDPESSEAVDIKNWTYAQDLVDKYNEVYEANDIYVQYKLVGVSVGPYGGLRYATSVIWDNFNADVGMGLNSTCPDACGCAYPGTRFYENSGRAQVGTSRCSYIVDLHEIGHAVGLAHGPENSANQGSGYIFPEFGHGWSTPFCSIYIDIMSYGGSKTMHHNSELTCEDYLKLRPGGYIKPEELDDPHGDRRFADATYAINRVRYDVALISRDNSEIKPELLPENDPEVSEAMPIVDHVKHYYNARQMILDRDRELREPLRLD